MGNVILIDFCAVDSSCGPTSRLREQLLVDVS